MTNQQLWQSVLGNLEVSISRGNFTTWFKNTAIIDRGQDSIILSVPNIFVRKWISDKFHLELLKVLKQLAPEIKEIKYQIGQQAKPEASSEPAPTATKTQGQAPAAAPTYRETNPANPTLNDKYVFDTFVIGKHNELAHAGSVAVSKNPGTQYNPLFIYGGVGLGKTHLMHAVGNKILADNPRAKVMYASAEKFTNDFVACIASKRMDEFKKLYRTVDVLLIDDVQFIGSKEQTQEEFFHTFNELRDKGRQIIMTADRLPKDIPGIEQRLVSRFEWGMIADIQAPDLETRLAILHNKVNKRGLVINEEVLYFIADNVISNVRELEGALNRLLVYQQMENKTLTIEHAKTILANMVNTKRKSVSLKKIAMSVADFYNI
jgi:chromosomal replication initiator protein